MLSHANELSMTTKRQGTIGAALPGGDGNPILPDARNRNEIRLRGGLRPSKRENDLRGMRRIVPRRW
jgi:hypothetical protein